MTSARVRTLKALDRPLRCYLYLRLSDDRKEIDSFPSRAKKLRAKAKALGWVVVEPPIIENDLMPNGKRNASAFKRRRLLMPDGTFKMRVYRPGFRAMLDNFRAGHADALLVEDLDRLCRDGHDAEDLFEVVRERRLNCASLTGSFQLTNGGNDTELMIARIVVAVAAKFSADTARRVAAERERQAESGRFGGGPRPYGFESDGETPIYEEYDVVRALGEAVLADETGLILRGLARDLNLRGVKTVSGRPWLAQTIRDILLRPRNAAIMVYRPVADKGERRRPHYTREEEVGRGSWPPIFEEDVWRAIVARLTDPSRTTRRGPANRWLGSGLYLCKCKAEVGVVSSPKLAPAYRCEDGGHVRRSQVAVDRLVVDTIVRLMERPDAAALFASKTTGGVDLSRLRADVAKWRTQKLALVDRELDEGFDEEQLRHGTRRLNRMIAEAQAVLRQHAARSPLAPLLEAEDVRATWEALPLVTQRSIVDALMIVTILPTTRRGRGFDEQSVRIQPRRRIPKG